MILSFPFPRFALLGWRPFGGHLLRISRASSFPPASRSSTPGVGSPKAALRIEVGSMVPPRHRDLRQAIRRSLGRALPELEAPVGLHAIAAVHGLTSAVPPKRARKTGRRSGSS